MKCTRETTGSSLQILNEGVKCEEQEKERE